MDIIISTLFETEWGLVILGIFIIGAILIDIFQKPKT